MRVLPQGSQATLFSQLQWLALPRLPLSTPSVSSSYLYCSSFSLYEALDSSSTQSQGHNSPSWNCPRHGTPSSWPRCSSLSPSAVCSSLTPGPMETSAQWCCSGHHSLLAPTLVTPSCAPALSVSLWFTFWAVHRTGVTSLANTLVLGSTS